LRKYLEVQDRSQNILRGVEDIIRRLRQEVEERILSDLLSGFEAVKDLVTEI
jgi:hypothetical protein